MKSMKISEASRKERKSLGLTQGQMIKESKISVTHYSKMENGQNRIFIDDLILILQLRGISITQFFKKYFPPNDNIDYSQISQELNQAFYDNDVKKAKELKLKILNTKHMSTELRDRANLIIAVLNSKDDKTDTAAVKQAMHDFFKHQEWMNDENAIVLLSNSIRKDNLNDVTHLVMMLIRKYKDLKEQSLIKQRRLATVGINYLYVLRKYFMDSDKVAFKILSWLESLATDPELCLLRELTLYFYFIYTNDDQAEGIKLILDQSGYKKISDNLPD